MLPPATPREARAAGLDSLASRQSRGGWWTAWRGIAGGSDEYPTAVIAATVATVPGGADLAARGWEALRGRGRFRRALGHAGWGWNETLPDDADTTSWALRAAHGTGCTDAADAAVLSLLDACSSPQGVASYAGDQPIREYHGDRFPEGYDMSTLTAPIPTITAAAALALPDRGPALREALRHAQHPDGTWRDLWWVTPALPTLLAVEALAAGGAGDAEPILAAATWGASVRPATAFDLACSVIVHCTAAALDPRWTEPALAGGAELVGAQRPDGSWAPGARLQVGDPGDLRPWEHPHGTAPGSLYPAARVLDGQGEVTTAFAVRALQEVADLAAAGAARG